MSKSAYLIAATTVAAAAAVIALMPPMIGRRIKTELGRHHAELVRDRHRERLRALADADLEAKLRR